MTIDAYVTAAVAARLDLRPHLEPEFLRAIGGDWPELWTLGQVVRGCEVLEVALSELFASWG